MTGLSRIVYRYLCVCVCESIYNVPYQCTYIHIHRNIKIRVCARLLSVFFFSVVRFLTFRESFTYSSVQLHTYIHAGIFICMCVYAALCICKC